MHRLRHPRSNHTNEAKKKALAREEAKAAKEVAAGTRTTALARGNQVSTTDDDEDMSPIVVPLRSFLRPCNIIGGGFLRTTTGLLPRCVITYWQHIVRDAQ